MIHSQELSTSDCNNTHPSPQYSPWNTKCVCVLQERTCYECVWTAALPMILTEFSKERSKLFQMTRYHEMRWAPFLVPTYSFKCYFQTCQTQLFINRNSTKILFDWALTLLPVKFGYVRWPSQAIVQFANRLPNTTKNVGLPKTKAFKSLRSFKVIVSTSFW